MWVAIPTPSPPRRVRAGMRPLARFVVGALDRPLALARRAGFAAVAQHRALEGGGGRDEALVVPRGVAEAGLPPRGGLRQRRGQRVGVLDDLHAAPAAARRRL